MASMRKVRCFVMKDLMDADKMLAPYPLKELYYFRSLSHLITEQLIQRVLPFSTVSSCSSSSYSSTDPKEWEIVFTKIDLKRSFSSTVPCEITAQSMDKSFLLTKLEGVILGEFQLSFILLLSTLNFEAFEHWKSILVLFSLSKTASTENPELFIKFKDALHLMLEQCPCDFFNDILVTENIVYVSLKVFVALIL